MPKFSVINPTSGQEMGIYEADSAEAALDAVYRDAGYKNAADCETSTGRANQLTATAVESEAAIDFIEFDVALRGTGIDPQEFANRTGLVIIEDPDAAAAGAPCWYGARGNRVALIKAYIAAGGSSVVYAYAPHTAC